MDATVRHFRIEATGPDILRDAVTAVRNIEPTAQIEERLNLGNRYGDIEAVHLWDVDAKQWMAIFREAETDARMQALFHGALAAVGLGNKHILGQAMDYLAIRRIP